MLPTNLSVVLALYARSTLGRINAEIELMVNDRMVKVEQLEQVKHNLSAIGQAATDRRLAPQALLISGDLTQRATRNRSAAFAQTLLGHLSGQRQRLPGRRIAGLAAVHQGGVVVLGGEQDHRQPGQGGIGGARPWSPRSSRGLTSVTPVGAEAGRKVELITADEGLIEAAKRAGMRHLVRELT